MIVVTVGAGGGVGTSTFGLLLAVALADGAGRTGSNTGTHDDSPTEVVYLEADQAGGVAGARFDLGVDGGLQAWVAGLASDPTLQVDGFGKVIASGLRVVPGPVSWTDAERLLAPAVTNMLTVAMARDSDRWWVVDLGRGGAASSPIADVADVALIIGSGLPEHVVRLPSLVSTARPAQCIAVVAGRSVWPAEEIRQHCGADAVIEGPEYRLPVDQVVDLVEGRKRRRNLAWRSVLRCRDAVADAATRLEPQTVSAPKRSAG